MAHLNETATHAGENCVGGPFCGGCLADYARRIYKQEERVSKFCPKVNK